MFVYCEDCGQLFRGRGEFSAHRLNGTGTGTGSAQCVDLSGDVRFKLQDTGTVVYYRFADNGGNKHV